MSTPLIDRNLNIVFPVETSKGKAWVHSVPISYEVFETHFMIISKTFAEIYSEGLQVAAGPRIAAIMMKRIAQDNKVWEGKEGVQNTLLAEIKRLTNVLVPNDDGSGYGLLPFDTAVGRGLLSINDVREAEGILIFFTCVSCIHTRRQIPGILMASSMWGAQATYSSITDYQSSLTTSMKADGSIKKAESSATS